jgi:hypothetical protein
LCEFISWVEYKEDIFFLTNDCLKTKEGKALRRYLGDQFKEDIKGHGAVRRYFGIPENKGTNKEYTDFSSPKCFPTKIKAAILDGSFSQIAAILPFQLLTNQAWAEYEKIEGPAWAEYKKIRGQALAEYEKIEGQAWAEYEKIRGQALAEYEKIRGQAWAEYKKIRGQALAEYEKIRGQAFWKLLKNPRNRIEVWR